MLKVLLQIPRFMLARRRLLKASDRYWQKRMSGRALTVDGRTLNPRAQGLIELQASFSVPVSKWTPGMMRGGYRKSIELFDGAKPDVTHVEDMEMVLDGRTLKARVYAPEKGGHAGPCTLFYHGGGFVIGDLNSHDNLCRNLALKTGNTVISVKYRLGPENRFPAAFEDGLDSWSWLQQNAETCNIDPNAVTVAGDSAGAVLALLIAGKAAKGELEGRPCSVTLIYPASTEIEDSGSRKLLSGEQIVLTQELRDWFAENFASDQLAKREDLLRPLDGVVAGSLPPFWILTCGLDPLRDDGVAIKDRLTAMGADVAFQEYSDMYHGFIGASAVFSEVDKMVSDMALFIQNKREQSVHVAAE
jgi:acetyl esterase/lipase